MRIQDFQVVFASKYSVSLAAISSIVLCVAASASVPQLAVTRQADRAQFFYSTYTQISSTQYSTEDSTMKAIITYTGTNTWRLDITAKQTLSEVIFPWQSQRTPLDNDITNDVYYYPYIMGMAERASYRNVDWTWYGLRYYPGALAAPLVVMADDASAKIVAAANWPPKTVTPFYAAQRMILEYDDPVLAGSTATYTAIVATVTGEAASGRVPWQLAVDLYKAWLDSKIQATYPGWMWDGQGFLNIQLQNYPTFDITSVDSLWQPVRSLYPWIGFWGQMGPYAIQGGGCCLLNYQMDPRYQPALPSWVAARSLEGNHVGYYSAPYYGLSDSDPLRPLDTQAGVDYLTGWLSANSGYSANSYYIDTLGRTYYGDPQQVLELFTSGVIPAESLIEGLVDIYPVAGLGSGALVGSNQLCGAPYKAVNTTNTVNSTTFPRFVRYILKDRMVYMGESNTDWRFWGDTQNWLQTGDDGNINATCGYAAYCSANGPCQYGTERQAFLLGARLDVMSPNDNPVLNAIISERQRVNWWPRRPVYLDTKDLDLTSIPPSAKVEITHFKDANSADLIAISNPNLVTGLSFTLNGNSHNVPATAITILDLGPAAPGNIGPVRSNGSPSGVLPKGTVQTMVSLSTNVSATCKWAPMAGVSYSAMTQVFSTNNGTFHQVTVSGLLAGKTYAYYVRCSDAGGTANRDDYLISFSLHRGRAGATKRFLVPGRLRLTR